MTTAQSLKQNTEGGCPLCERKDPAKPWDEFDPEDRANLVFTLRLNEYEFAMLRWLAEQNEDLSMQKIVRRALVPELRRRAGVEG